MPILFFAVSSYPYFFYSVFPPFSFSQTKTPPPSLFFFFLPAFTSPKTLYTPRQFSQANLPFQPSSHPDTVFFPRFPSFLHIHPPHVNPFLLSYLSLTFPPLYTYIVCSPLVFPPLVIFSSRISSPCFPFKSLGFVDRPPPKYDPLGTHPPFVPFSCFSHLSIPPLPRFCLTYFSLKAFPYLFQ